MPTETAQAYFTPGPTQGNAHAQSKAQDRVRAIITHTELSLVMLGFMYYYLVQLPEQQRTITKKGPR